MTLRSCSPGLTGRQLLVLRSIELMADLAELPRGDEVDPMREQRQVIVRLKSSWMWLVSEYPQMMELSHGRY